MKVLVIGAGLMGLTSAYYLAREGCDVTVLDQDAGPGCGASFANGSLLTPSMPQPWNSPGVGRMLLRSLVTSHTALKLRLSALPGLLGWGTKFLQNSAPDSVQRATVSNLHLALYSLRLMKELREDTSIEYSRSACGTLRVFRDAAALDAASGAAELLKAEGLAYERLQPDDVARREPALAPISPQLSGALLYPNDETGNALRFCETLADVISRRGVRLQYNAPVLRIDVQRNRVACVRSKAGSLTADAYIVAAGCYSAPLLEPLGIDLPVRPAKGYSITLPPGNPQVLDIPVIDDDLHAAVVPLGGALRLAGTAEFAGFDRSLHQARIDNLFRLLALLLPRHSFDKGTALAWCGLRPMSADGVPIIGRTEIENLLVNAGHGPLGWTMAVGSGRLLTDILLDKPAQLEPMPYSLNRFAFSPSSRLAILRNLQLVRSAVRS